MKQNYRDIKKGIISIVLLFIISIGYSQDIHFTFANTLNTNDGSNDYFEADVMIQTINSTGDFKLGSGQLYFTYNTLAFGDGVNDNSRFEVIHPNVEGYICGQYVDAAAADIYGTFTTNDNTTSRVSWSFSQTFASATFTADNVTAAPTKLCRIKFQYVDVNQDPMVAFETGDTYLNQFFTACGPDTGGPFETANCGDNPGIQIVNDSFDSSGSTLSANNYDLFEGLLVYPNPTKEILYVDINQRSNYSVIDMFGKIIKTGKLQNGQNELYITRIPSGVYFLQLTNDKGSIIKKIIKN